MQTTSERIKVGKRGVITLPQEVRDAHDLEPGDHLRLVDLDGVLVLTDRTEEVDQLSDRIREKLEENDESLSSMLEALREEREAYGDDA
jgi:AbrB family looped-hinge helix DNA binding protein